MAVVLYNFSASDYIAHWIGLYKHNKDNSMKIKQACENKLANDLIPTDQMIELIKKSNDRVSEKEKAINYLLGKENEKTQSLKIHSSYYYLNEDEFTEDID